MDLKLIGHFASDSEAREARDAIDILTKAAEQERDDGRLEYDEPPEIFSNRLLEAMSGTGVHSLSHADVEQFLYEAHVEAEGTDVVVRTEEIDVLAYVKVLIAKGARVEIYSMHDYNSSVRDE